MAARHATVSPSRVFEPIPIRLSKWTPSFPQRIQQQTQPRIPWSVQIFGLERSPLAPIRQLVREKRSNWKSYRARVQLESKLKDFSSPLFQNEVARDSLRAFYAAYAEHDLQSLRSICTEPFFKAVKAGLEECEQTHGEIRGMDVVNFLEPIQILQIRLLYGKTGEPMHGMVSDPTHAQISAKVISRQLPVSLRPHAEEQPRALIQTNRTPKTSSQKYSKVKSASGKTKYIPVDNKSNEAVAKSGPSSTNTLQRTHGSGVWLPAVDYASGRVFYYNQDNGKTTWEPPIQLGAVGVAPFRIEDAGFAREPIPDDTVEDGTPFFRVENLVTWERPFQIGSKWQICAV